MTVNRVGSVTAWTEVRADRAKLVADLAAKAVPAVIAADKAQLLLSQRRYAAERGRLDVTV